jgi:hypothetical protein
VTRIAGPLRGGAGVAVRFDRDRKRFADTWLTSGRAARLGGRLAGAVRELERFAEISAAIVGGPRRGWCESAAGHRARVGRLLDEARHYPMLTEALADMTAESRNPTSFLSADAGG